VGSSYIVLYDDDKWLQLLMTQVYDDNCTWNDFLASNMMLFSIYNYYLYFLRWSISFASKNGLSIFTMPRSRHVVQVFS
jgi:hypothetical protein